MDEIKVSPKEFEDEIYNKIKQLKRAKLQNDNVLKYGLITDNVVFIKPKDDGTQNPDALLDIIEEKNAVRCVTLQVYEGKSKKHNDTTWLIMQKNQKSLSGTDIEALPQRQSLGEILREASEKQHQIWKNDLLEKEKAEQQRKYQIVKNNKKILAKKHEKALDEIEKLKEENKQQAEKHKSDMLDKALGLANTPIGMQGLGMIIAKLTGTEIPNASLQGIGSEQANEALKFCNELHELYGSDLVENFFDGLKTFENAPEILQHFYNELKQLKQQQN